MYLILVLAEFKYTMNQKILRLIKTSYLQSLTPSLHFRNNNKNTNSFRKHTRDYITPGNTFALIKKCL